MLRIAFITALLMSSSLHAQQLMTLEDAITLGLKNNYDIRIARNEAMMSENNRGLGLAGFLPTLDASGGLSRSNTEREVDLPTSTTNTDSDNLSADINLNWTIFDGFNMFINRNRYNELARLGHFQARNQIENSVVDISQAYLNLVRQEQVLAVAREVRDISSTRLHRERVRNELGGSSTTDFLNAQVAFNSDETSLLEQELAVTVVREQLNLLLGQDPATMFTVSTEIAIPELGLSYDEIRNLAREHNSSLQAAELASKIADRSVQSARSSFMPRLSAFANYGYDDRTDNSDIGTYAGLDVGTKTTSSTIGLNLTLNIFNGRRDYIDLQNAKIEANNQALALRDARNRLDGLVQQTYETYQRRMEIVKLEEQNIIAARQNLDVQKERHELGVANSLEFRDAQVSFARAQTSLITARYEARISHLELQQLTGAIDIDLES